MTDAAFMADTQDIVVDEVFPHASSVVWTTLTTPDLMSRWLGMTPRGFEPTIGSRFAYQTTPAGEWDGVIHCEVLEVIPNERLVYTWTGGHAGNVGYGSRLETVVTWTLAQAERGTRLRVVHAGFRRPTNASAFENMSRGWPKALQRIDAVARDHDALKPQP